MSTRIKPWTQVFEIPELAVEVISRLEPKSLHALRLANKDFLSACAPYFAITLDVDEELRYADLEPMVITAINNLKEYEYDDEGRDNHNPLNKIQSLKIQSGHKLYLRLAKAVPGGSMARILNRCRERRHPGGRFRRDIANELTSSTALYERVYDPDKHTLMHLASMKGNHPIWGEHIDRQAYARPWSFWDLFPLEERGGLNMLETLAIDLGSYAPENLDQFFSRLSRSSMTKTLNSLTVVESLRESNEVSWGVLRHCVCELKVLKVLKIERVRIFSPLQGSWSPHHSPNMVVFGCDSLVEQLWRHQKWIAPTVQSLTIRCTFHPELNVAIMALFPNLRYLAVRGLDFLRQDGIEVLGQDGDTTSNNNNHRLPREGTLPTPFPALISLDAPIISINHWNRSRILQNWVKRLQRQSPQSSLPLATPLATTMTTTRPTPFELVTLNFDHSPCDSTVPSLRSKELLVQRLSQESVSVKKFMIASEDPDWICRILMSATFRNLQELVVKVLAPLSPHVPPPILPLESLPASELSSSLSPSSPSLPASSSSEPSKVTSLFVAPSSTWTRTLTKLCLLSPLKSVVASERTTISMRTVLLMLPQLNDFEILDPIRDLEIFEGLGRLASTSTVTAPALAAAIISAVAASNTGTSSSSSSIPSPKSLVSSPYQMKDYTYTERPALKRLKLCQSHLCRSFSPHLIKDPLAPWRAKLQYKFRFLDDLFLEVKFDPLENNRKR